MRRQVARRARRKQQLMRFLVSMELLPSDRRELDSLWGIEPLGLRVRALSERLEPHELGRLLIHLNQRRGFKSNRKGESDKEQKGLLQEISDHEAKMRADGSRTLGEYLSSRHVAGVDARGTPMVRVRGLHTRRSMFEDEFETIWTAQVAHHPTMLTDELRDGLRRLIFFQRPIKPPPKWLVGKCELDPAQKRCPRAERPAQRFRLLQEVNNLAIIDRSTGEVRALTEGERKIVVDLLSKKDKATFDDIRKKLGFLESVRFNLEGPEREKLKGHETDCKLAGKNAFGKEWWTLPEATRDKIVEILIEESDLDKTVHRLMTEVSERKMSEETARRIAPLNFPEGYASYGRETIRRLLPHLERGLKMMGNDATDSALHAAGFLRPDQREVKTHDLLPPPPPLTNPIVRQAMYEVRKVVNAIIREYGRPDVIRVELAREAKMSFEQRKQLRFDNADRQRARTVAREEIERLGFKPTGEALERYVLWKEQGEECIYSGRTISPAQLLGGEVHIDHILPRNRSLDNSKMNKVVCFRDANAEKGDRTPREWLESSDPKRYDEVLKRAESLPFGKSRKFGQKEIVLDEFIARQLTDTAYISRACSQYLKCLGASVETQRGQMTADLRRLWGLNKILGNSEDHKDRSDHRHHAVDAVIVALTNKKRLHALANGNIKRIDPPKDGFRDRVAEKIRAIIVSHRVRRKVCGALHEETFYGATQKRASEGRMPPGGETRKWAKGWIEEKAAFVRRKPLSSLTKATDLEKVRDATIRRILEDHLRAKHIDPSSRAKLPKGVFEGENTPTMPSGVPIRKVRMIEESETIQPVSERRSYQNVKSGSNHHIAYYEVVERGRKKWEAVVTTMFDAARQVKPAVPEGGRLVMTLSIGECFAAEDESGVPKFYIVRKMDQRSGRIAYKEHTDARASGELNEDNLVFGASRLMEAKARKVTIDPLGRVRRAND
ncbi:MAG: type II CRISPR RNA-guided endonuclease Cas9 [Phycisphaerae bacterium]|nr:type II CRISPR RNA-guided endonuclease Cas9 [Phycisphaerae bacterium]